MADNEIKKRNTAYKLSIGLVMNGNPELEKDGEGRERFRALALNDKQVSRVNIIANVIDKFQSNEKAYTNLTIDDGTGNMRIKAFGDATPLLKEIELGDTILVIGRLGYFNEEVYILPEIVKKYDPRWLLARKLELTKEFGNVYAEEKHAQPIQPVDISHSQTPYQTNTETKQSSETNEGYSEERIEKIDKFERQTGLQIQSEQQQPSLPEGLTLRDKVLEKIKIAEAQEGIDIDNLIGQISAPQEKVREIIMEMLESGEIFEPRPGRLRVL